MTNPVLFGWDASVRALLAVVAAGAGLGLGLCQNGQGDPSPPVAELVVDPNTAPAEVLLALPRLGPTLVGRIIAARERSPFVDLDDLDHRVRGVGPATMAALRPHFSIAPRP